MSNTQLPLKDLFHDRNKKQNKNSNRVKLKPEYLLKFNQKYYFVLIRAVLKTLSSLY